MPKKILITIFLTLLSTWLFAQTREYTLQDGTKLIVPDFNNIVLIDGSKPVEIHVNKGVGYQFLIVEFRDTLTQKSIVLEPKIPAPVLKEFVNDFDSRITYSTGWQKFSGLSWTQKFNNNDVNATYAVGSSANFVFTGRKVEVISEKCDNHSSFKIDLVKGTEVIESKVIDLYQSTGGTATNACPAGVVQAVYTSADLPQGTYNIKVTFDSTDLTKVPQRNSGVLDGFKVYE